MRAASKIRESLGRLRLWALISAQQSWAWKLSFTPEVQQLERSEAIAIDMMKAYAIAKKQQAEIYFGVGHDTDATLRNSSAFNSCQNELHKGLRKRDR